MLSKQQTIGLAISPVLPIIITLLFRFGISPIPGFNLAPLTQLLVGPFGAWMLLQNHAFRVVPIARSALFEHISDGMLVVDSNNRIIDMNLAAQHMLGHTFQAARGLHSAQLLAQWPDLVERLDDPCLQQAEFLLPGNPHRYFDLRITPLYDDGNQFAGRLCNFREITVQKGVEEALRQAHIDMEMRIQERTADLIQANKTLETEIAERRRAEQYLRESEEWFRAVVEGSPNGIVTVDENGLIIMVNDQLEKLFGYRRDELLRKPIEILMPNYHRSQHREHRDHYFNAPWVRMMADSPIVHGLRKDGSEFPIEIALSSFKTASGTHALGTIIDVTTRLQAETERKQLEAQLQHAQKLESLGILAGGIAHDFNNLLTGVLVYSDLALRKLPADAPARHSVGEAIKVARQASQLTQQMLAYSGKGQFVVEPLDLSHLITEMRPLLQVSISKKCHITYRLLPGLPQIAGDIAQIRQVIMNLVINASEAIGEHNGEICVSLTCQKCDRTYLAKTYLDDGLEEGHYVVLEVKDSGQGMSEETRLKVFDPFFTTKFTGRGLGLAAVLGIVRGHHGAISVESTPGRGTTFRVLFPIANQVAQAATPEIDNSNEWRGSGTILVVDDEKSVREAAQHLLATSGFDVLLAADGREALEIFQRECTQIRLVLLDMTMPHLDGEETLCEMRKIRSDVCTILSSGYNEQTTLKRFADKGLAGFLPKPYSYDQLIHVFRKVLDN